MDLSSLWDENKTVFSTTIKEESQNYLIPNWTQPNKIYQVQDGRTKLHVKP